MRHIVFAVLGVRASRLARGTRSSRRSIIQRTGPSASRKAEPTLIAWSRLIPVSASWSSCPTAAIAKRPSGGALRAPCGCATSAIPFGSAVVRWAAAMATTTSRRAAIGAMHRFPMVMVAGRGASRKFATRPEVGRRQTSTLAANALSWMNCRRGSTRSPISWSNSTFASSTSLIRTCSSERALVSSVVSQSCSGFISPKPL